MDLLRRWVPFFNAAIQGTDKEVRALANIHLWWKQGQKLTTKERDLLQDAQVAWCPRAGHGGRARNGRGAPQRRERGLSIGLEV